MRLIDADALKTTMDECIYSDRDRFSTGYAKSFIDDAPTVDAVPVARCKDCKYYGRVDKRRFYRGSDCIKNIINTIVPDTDFCSRGERRE